MAFLFKKDGRYYIAAKVDGRWLRRSTGFTREEEAKKVYRRVSNRLADGLPPFEALISPFPSAMPNERFIWAGEDESYCKSQAGCQRTNC